MTEYVDSLWWFAVWIAAGIISGIALAALLLALSPGPVPEYIVEHDFHIRSWYPYSVVPGGVRSPEEVEQAIANDPVVAEHYKGIWAAGLVPLHTYFPLWRYVSYRVGQHILWTRTKVLIGDDVLSDARGHVIRQRCGNLISLTPPEVTEQPPSVIVPPSYLPPIFTETPFPVLAPPRLPGTPEIEYPPEQNYPPLQTAQAPGWYGFPLPVLCCFFGGGGGAIPMHGRKPRGGRPPRLMPVPVPEPATWGLLSLGCLILLVKRCNH